MFAAPNTSTIYRGEGGGCAPSRVSTPRGAAAPNPSRVAAKWRGEGGAPGMGLKGPSALGFAPSSLQAHGPWWGGAPALLGAGPFSHLAHVCLRGLVAPPGGPPDPSGGPGTLLVMPGTLPVAKTILPIYKSLPPDHSGTPRDVRDLIRDSEQHSVTTYILSL